MCGFIMIIESCSERNVITITDPDTEGAALSVAAGLRTSFADKEFGYKNSMCD